MTLIITAEGEKLWYEVPTVFPKQRFYVASDTQAFAVTRPTLAYTTNRAGQVDTIEVSAGAFAKRKQ